MARNSAGTYTLPAATNPVVSGTQITPTWANGTLGDLASEVTDSLSRSGKGGMTAPLRVEDGVVGAPSLSFTSETGTGFYRSAAGVIRAAILGVYKLSLSAAGLVVDGVLLATGKVTASAGLDVTGTLAVMDDGGTSKKVTVDAPTGLVADYALVLPTALPGSTLPVTLTSAGVLSTDQLVNAQQNFGTPSAATDVVILSYLVSENAAVSAVNANLSDPPSVTRRAAVGLAWFTSATNVTSVTGAVTGAAAGGSTAAATALFTLPAGYRPPATASATYILPIRWYDQSTAVLRPASLIFSANDGVAYFHAEVGGTKQDLANGDILYVESGAVWAAT